MPFVYFHWSDGKRYYFDRRGQYVASDALVQNEAKRILARHLIESEASSSTMGLSVEARDITGRTIFQASVIAAVW
ncbi:DUF6894 family protein [Pararhizobium sp. PWRC1-1]|uniref:DUF6894 family protein n=1 Tax=Pararhizobium sp. PWRC1-1 TaxID=2804566 RepID=UPI003CF0C324